MAAQHVRHRLEHSKINDPLSIRVNRQWIIVVVLAATADDGVLIFPLLEPRTSQPKWPADINIECIMVHGMWFSFDGRVWRECVCVWVRGMNGAGQRRWTCTLFGRFAWISFGSSSSYWSVHVSFSHLRFRHVRAKSNLIWTKIIHSFILKWTTA